MHYYEKRLKSVALSVAEITKAERKNSQTVDFYLFSYLPEEMG